MTSNPVRETVETVELTSTATLIDPAATTDTAPEAPVDSPTSWALLAFARREFGPAATAATAPPAETLTTELTASTAADWQNLYTGQPSLVHQLIVTGLRALEVVLSPVGGLLSFTSLQIPIFTDGVPPFFLTPGLNVERTEFNGMPVWTLNRPDANGKYVVALHGGAYVGQVSIFHWWTYANMARNTGANVVVPLYTLAPAGTAASEVPRTADFISTLIDTHGAGNVSVLGDSAGGGLALAAVQELARRNSTMPARLVLLAPWLDVSMSDPRSAAIDDPLLDIPNLVSAGEKWAGTPGSTGDPLASPLFGSLDGLPPTFVYSSSLDLLTVDTLRLRDRVLAENIPGFTFRLRRGLIHDYVTFPFLPDARAERGNIYGDLFGSEPTPVAP